MIHNYVAELACLVGEDWPNWPRVEYPDIYNYLIQTPSVYTGESLKAYKSLDSYRYHTDGWVGKVKVCKILRLASPNFMVTASVRHSQRLQQSHGWQ